MRSERAKQPQFAVVGAGKRNPKCYRNVPCADDAWLMRGLDSSNRSAMARLTESRIANVDRLWAATEQPEVGGAQHLQAIPAWHRRGHACLTHGEKDTVIAEGRPTGQRSRDTHAPFAKMLVRASNLVRTSAVSRGWMRQLVTSGGIDSVKGPKHQPLGVPPDGTDIDEVRSKWGSNAMDLIQAAPPVYVKGPVAICDGGGGALGHPIEYIQLKRADPRFPAVCKYCGTKFIRTE